MKKNTYDEIVYDQLPHRQGNLRALETIADIHGLRPADIRDCRVLELGTGTGKMLLPQAEDFPGSTFIGIDLSAKQIADGRTLADELDLKNITLECEDIMNIGPEWGRFDYILVHGIYSWVPPLVRDKILAICRACLAPDGIAMISYNTYPGWHGKEMVRKLMQFHTRTAQALPTAQREIEEARAVLDSFAEIKARQDGYDASVFAMVKKQLADSPDAYVFHEYLETENLPCYFVDFHDRLKKQDLEHVADFDWNTLECCMMQPEIGRFLRQAASLRDREQYIDFFVNRMFRADVICRAEAAATSGPRSDIGKRYPMRVPNKVRIDRTTTGAWNFEGGFGDTSTVNVPIPGSPINDLLVDWLVARRPYYFTYEQLRREWFQSARRRGIAIAESGELEALLARFLRLGILQATLHPGSNGSMGEGTNEGANILGKTSRETDTEKKPIASGFVRSLARRKCNKITNADFETLEMNSTLHFIVPRLDGRHSVRDLARLFRSEIQSGRFTPGDRNGTPFRSDDETAITRTIESALEQLQRFSTY